MLLLVLFKDLPFLKPHHCLTNHFVFFVYVKKSISLFFSKIEPERTETDDFKKVKYFGVRKFNIKRFSS